MLFNSYIFPVFFTIVTAVYFLLPHRFRWALLLAASYYFYMCWKAEYLALILISTGIDYAAALAMEKKPDRKQRTPLLILSLATNLGLLFVFKYFNFFSTSTNAVMDAFNLAHHLPQLKVLLPVGISFYTFQTLSYTIDVYRGQRTAEKHLGIFALYVAFFPQLVAGPIERSTHLLPQFFKKVDFNYTRVCMGLQLMLWGLFKKVIIADRLALIVDQIYNNPLEYTGLPLWFGTYCFAFQIYCDFSGYSDIAIGAAAVLGFSLMENFRQPYLSKSMAEFWHRWHISLSSWFRDYLYIPLGGNRTAVSRWTLNILIVFILSGIWHGANYTFLFWGALHGIYLLASRFTAGARAGIAAKTPLARMPGVHKGLKILITFHLVCFAWIFFRANNLADAFYIAGSLFQNLAPQLSDCLSWSWNETYFGPFDLGIGMYQFTILAAAWLIMECGHLLQRNGSLREIIAAQPLILRWPVYYALILAVIFFAVDGSSQFIYFQF